jgi:hypothetical protein
MHLRRLENICEKKEQCLSCNENLPDPFANGIVRIDNNNNDQAVIHQEQLGLFF